MRKTLGIITVLMLCVNFSLWLKVQPVKAVGTVYIKPDGSVDPPGTPIQQNGNNYAFTGDISASIIVQKSNIVIDGEGHLLQGSGVENGIDLSGLTDVTVKSITIKIFDYGIYVFSSHHITLSGNTIINNNDGIWLLESTDNLVNGNLIKGNYLDGIYIWSSSNNIIFQNNVENNPYGISPYYCSNDRVFHNNFVNNGYNTNPNEPTDIWDEGYPAGGNYWSDYTGADTNGDGIGNTPYAIDTNNRDNYPLMQPWTPPDTAVTHLTPYKTMFNSFNSPPYYPLPINVSVTNQGNKIEGFNVTVYANTTLIQRKYIELNKNNSATITYLWNATGLPEYVNYTIRAYAEPLQGETHLSDNTLTYSPLTAVHVGDINGDRKVDIQDVSRVSGAFGSYPGHRKWNVLCDITNDKKVDIQDLARTCKNFGWHL